LDRFSEELRTNFWWLGSLSFTLSAAKGKNKVEPVKTRVEKEAAVVPSSGCSQEYNLQSSKTENRAD